MDMKIIMPRIGEALAEGNIQTLHSIAATLAQCVCTQTTRGVYSVVDRNNPPYELFSGERGECVAFIDGYYSSPKPDVGDGSCLCVCIDGGIVIPEELLGERVQN